MQGLQGWKVGQAKQGSSASLEMPQGLIRQHARHVLRHNLGQTKTSMDVIWFIALHGVHYVGISSTK